MMLDFNNVFSSVKGAVPLQVIIVTVLPMLHISVVDVSVEWMDNEQEIMPLWMYKFV